jgi:hypothetical protein
VNLAYYRDHTKEWVSVSGLAVASRHRPRIRALYEPSWKVWFPESADPSHGTAEDPRMVLVGVTAHAALFQRSDKPGPLATLELFRGYVTGHDQVRRGGRAAWAPHTAAAVVGPSGTSRKPVRRRVGCACRR